MAATCQVRPGWGFVVRAVYNTREGLEASLTKKRFVCTSVGGVVDVDSWHLLPQPPQNLGECVVCHSACHVHTHRELCLTQHVELDNYFSPLVLKLNTDCWQTHNPAMFLMFAEAFFS